jgi:predicted DNA binding CopG/RHH family protein
VCEEDTSSDDEWDPAQEQDEEDEEDEQDERNQGLADRRVRRKQTLYMHMHARVCVRLSGSLPLRTSKAVGREHAPSASSSTLKPQFLL